MLTKKNKSLLSENKIITRQPKQTRKKAIITNIKDKIITITTATVTFINIYCFVTLTYPINRFLSFNLLKYLRFKKKLKNEKEKRN